MSATDSHDRTGEAIFGELADSAGVEVFIHAVDVDTGAEVGYQPDASVIPASVFKVLVLVELFRQVEQGQVDAAEQVTVEVEGRCDGPFGLPIMRDPVTMSLRDLAWMMIGFSDNAASDVLCDRVGLDRVNALAAELGLAGTQVAGGCRELHRTFGQDAGITSAEDFPPHPDRAFLDRLRGIDPERGLQRTTARDMTRLLRLVWRDEAAPSGACAEVRRMLGLQVWPHRLAAGFPEPDVRTSGKTGTLPRWRNEVGVVSRDQGPAVAVAVFTRRTEHLPKDPAADALVGRAARAAVALVRPDLLDWLTG